MRPTSSSSSSSDKTTSTTSSRHRADIIVATERQRRRVSDSVAMTARQHLPAFCQYDCRTIHQHHGMVGKHGRPLDHQMMASSECYFSLPDLINEHNSPVTKTGNAFCQIALSATQWKFISIQTPSTQLDCVYRPLQTQTCNVFLANDRRR